MAVLPAVVEDGRMTPANLSALLHDRVRELADQPLLTSYDAATGARTELGYATGANWVWKLANLLAEELDVGPGRLVGSALGTHWTTAVTALACWQVGAAVALTETAGVAVVVTREDRLASFSGVPLVAVGAGMGGRVTGDVGDAVAFDEVLAFADDHDDPDVGDDAPAVVADGVTLDQRGALAAAEESAARLGLTAQGRLLIADDLETVDGLVRGLLAAVVAGASVVVTCGYAGEALEEIAAAERVTARLR
jgi:uncharacterized protein (TIGR03089 family)